MKRTSILTVMAAVLVLMLALTASAATVNCSGVAAWSPNSVSYSVGTLVTYSGSEYKCLQAHTSQAGWDPADVPALWSLQGTCGSGGATPTPTPKPTASPTPKGATPTPTPANTGGNCWPAWSSSAVYTGGAQVSYGNENYQAAYWTQGNNPSTSSGPAGSGQPWIPESGCSGSGGGSTPTPTPKSATPTPTSTGGNGGGKLFAPYIDISLSTDENPSGIASSAGLKAITLAFLSAGGCSTGWGGLGGTLPTDNFPNGDTVSNQVSKLQSEGVTVIISTGGASGTDPASFCGSASSLQAVYQQVINQYHINRLDFDIEGGAQDNHTENALRAQALKGLKSANSGLTISFTLPVLNSGLTSDGLTPINDSSSNGFSPDIVNVMAMDYGSCCDNGGAMDQAAEGAASSTHSQTGKTIGITPMIGQNDTGGEIFTLQDATNVVNWANGQSYVGLMAFWSLARDNGGCSGQTWASATCSGVSQSNYQFSSIFRGF